MICGRDSDGVWGLPKGTPNEGETIEETALREVSEETGLEVRDRRQDRRRRVLVRPVAASATTSGFIIT